MNKPRSSYNIVLSDLACRALRIMIANKGVKPEAALRVVVEGFLADACTQSDLRRDFVKWCKDPEEFTQGLWREASATYKTIHERSAYGEQG